LLTQTIIQGKNNYSNKFSALLIIAFIPLVWSKRFAKNRVTVLSVSTANIHTFPRPYSENECHCITFGFFFWLEALLHNILYTLLIRVLFLFSIWFGSADMQTKPEWVDSIILNFISFSTKYIGFPHFVDLSELWLEFIAITKKQRRIVLLDFCTL